MNDIYEELSEYEPFIAKIDIEGAEFDLFRENLEWVDATPIITIELHDWHTPGCSATFHQCVNAKGRSTLRGMNGDVLSLRQASDMR